MQTNTMQQTPRNLLQCFVGNSNCYFEPPATFIHFFRSFFGTINEYLEYSRKNNTTVRKDRFDHLFGLRYTFADVVLLIVLSYLWFRVRRFITRFVSEPLSEKFNLSAKNKKRLIDSLWNFLVHCFLFAWVANILIFKADECSLLYRSSLVWKDSDPTKPLPDEVRYFLLAQVSYYMFCTFSLFKLDEKRKDVYALITHHFVTLSLITIAYTTRLWKIGLLSLFVHDICDIFLGVMKCSIQLKEDKHGNVNKTIDIIATVSGIVFVICWVVFRLYYFPLKVVYAMTFVPRDSYYFELTLYTAVGVVVILLLNCYWSFLILKLVYKMALGHGACDTTLEEKKDE